LPVEFDAARRRFKKTEDRTSQCCLPRTRLSDETEGLPALQSKTNAVDCPNGPDFALKYDAAPDRKVDFEGLNEEQRSLSQRRYQLWL
jgi:hypothetical protein